MNTSLNTHQERRGRYTTQRFVAVLVVFAFSLEASGCYSLFGTPSLKHGITGFREGPDVVALIWHTNCEIATAMYKSLPDADADSVSADDQRRAMLWKRLSDNNFVAAVRTWFKHGGLRQSLSQNVDTPDGESDIQASGNGIRHLG
jgi:hypothetical protein